MARVVVINAMCSRWPEPKGEGVEIWTVNRAHTVEPRTDRVYYFDPEPLFLPGFVDSVAALGVPVYTRKPHPDIPTSRAYPLGEMTRYFGIEYSTSTVAWMIQHAIYEHCNGSPIDRLVLNGMYHPRDSVEYLWAIPCINFWVGVAMGRGMNVQCYGNNALVRAMPWESNCYGYRRNVYGELAIATLSAAYKACYEYPRKFMTAEEEMATTEDYETLVNSRRVLANQLKQVDAALERFEPQGAA
jgi:hypothetical protein